MSRGELFIALIACGIALVIGARFIVRRRVTGRHPALELGEIYSTTAPSVSFSTFKDVYGTLGNAFAIDPRTIRPDDALKAYTVMDSWSLGAGTEKLQRWMKSVGVPDDVPPPATVLDILVLVERRNGERQP